MQEKTKDWNESFGAREFYPEYPGSLDIGLFQMGGEEKKKQKRD